MTITAHSGAFDTPENSLENIVRVLDENCEIFEIDVTFRPSGTPVIMHAEAPSEEAGVLLRDVFELVARNDTIRMNLDLKSPLNIPAIDRLLKEYGLFDRAFYTGVTEEWVAPLRANSALPYYLNDRVDQDLRDDIPTLTFLAEKIAKFGALGLNTHYENVHPALIDVFHAKGLPVSVWTIDDAVTAQKYIKMGVDNITSRRPDIVKFSL